MMVMVEVILVVIVMKAAEFKMVMMVVKMALVMKMVSLWS